MNTTALRLDKTPIIRSKIKNENNILKFPTKQTAPKFPSMGCCRAQQLDWVFDKF